MTQGQFRRGGGSCVDAAIWFCELRGFTELSDSRPVHEIVSILDDYFEAVSGPIEDAGGEILKFIGDAVMAVFRFDGDESRACRQALAAADNALSALARRSAEAGSAKLEIGIGLHTGEVYYGNAGGRSRLDFTVVGAAVNDACRIEAQCKALKCPLLMSARFARHLDSPEVMSLGERALKGVAQPRELLTLKKYAPKPASSPGTSRLYRYGQRQLQDEFSSRGLADRLERVNLRTEFNESDRQFIENAAFFFFATASSDGRPSVSHKGGPAGLVRVVGPAELAYPDYDGNGMFMSLGNVLENPNVSLLFIDFENPRRLVVQGTASIHREDPLLERTTGAQLIVRITAHAIYPNCPRYIHRMKLLEPSKYVPRTSEAPVEPAWKSFPEFRDVVPPRRR